VLQRWAGIVGEKCNGKNIPMIFSPPTDRYLAFHRADQPSKKFTIAENLWSMIFNPDGSEKMEKCLQRPVAVEAHAQGMKADFIYGNWALAQGENLEIDPDTATLSDPTEDGHIYWDSDVTYTRHNTDDYLEVGTASVPTEYYPKRAYVEWDVSGLPVGAIITDTVFKYEGQGGGTGDCYIREMLGVRPSTSPDNNAGNQAVFDEAGEGTIYVTPAEFPGVGANLSEDLGTTADTDLQGQIGSWFAIGMQAQNEETFGGYGFIESEDKTDAADPKPTLYVEYSVGWTGKISGITNPAKIMGIPVADIAKVKGIAD